VWLIDRKGKGRPHDKSPGVVSHGQVAEHAPDHVTARDGPARQLNCLAKTQELPAFLSVVGSTLG